MSKYILSDIEKTVYYLNKFESAKEESIVVHRIQRIDTEEYGGWVESIDNLSQDGNCWISGDAVVIGNSKVESNAQVLDNAMVIDSIISDNSIINGNAYIAKASIYNYSIANDNAHVYKSILKDHSKVYDNAVVIDSTITDYSRIYEHAYINCCIVNDFAEIFGRIDLTSCTIKNYSKVSGSGSIEDCHILDFVDIDGDVETALYNNVAITFERILGSAYTKDNKLYITMTSNTHLTPEDVEYIISKYKSNSSYTITELSTVEHPTAKSYCIIYSDTYDILAYMVPYRAINTSNPAHIVTSIYYDYIIHFDIDENVEYNKLLSGKYKANPNACIEETMRLTNLYYEVDK